MSTFNDLVLAFDQSPQALKDLGLFLCIGSDAYDFADSTVSGNQLSGFESGGSLDESKRFVKGATYSLAWGTPGENNAPVIGGPDSVTITVDENIPGNIGDAFSASDDGGGAITWSVDGAAADRFISISAGQLSVKSAYGLNYEAMAIIQFTVIASDGVATDSVAVTVRVIDVDEPPQGCVVTDLLCATLTVEVVDSVHGPIGYARGEIWVAFGYRVRTWRSHIRNCSFDFGERFVKAEFRG